MTDEIKEFMEYVHQIYTVTCEHMGDELDFLTNQQLNSLIETLSSVKQHTENYQKLLKQKDTVSKKEEEILSYLMIIDAASIELIKKFKQARHIHH